MDVRPGGRDSKQVGGRESDQVGGREYDRGGRRRGRESDRWGEGERPRARVSTGGETDQEAPSDAKEGGETASEDETKANGEEPEQTTRKGGGTMKFRNGIRVGQIQI